MTLKRILLLAASTSTLVLGPAQAAADPVVDQKAQVMISAMTLEEKDAVVHGVMPLPVFSSTQFPSDAILGAGYVPGVPRVGFPALKETDASLGVAYVFGLRKDGATALPSSLATAASFDPQIAYAGGAMAGREARLKGFNVLLGGGVDLARDPRNGRNFEYLGEDPLLAGTLVGAAIKGTQNQHVISTIKHFALNDQETLRNSLSAEIAEPAARESDLLAFEIGIEIGKPGSVMCAYNRYGGPYACGNDFLLNQVLKRDWRYPGFVMSDWGAVHATDDALKGLDQQSGEQLDKKIWFGPPLLEAARADPAYRARLDDMATRIARSLIAVGVIDHPAAVGEIDMAADAEVARRGAEEGLVLLKNAHSALPLAGSVGRIAIIGGHADAGVLSGGGSSQVAPVGGPALSEPVGGEGQMAMFRKIFYMPSSPLQALKHALPAADVHFDDGRYPASAAALAARSDVVIIFATQWMMEGYDAPDLSLPQGQDDMIEAVAAANPNTIVVLETGGPVLMPWLGHVRAVLEAWYPGAKGGDAIADLIVGNVSPSGRLPITFPASEAQIPRQKTPGWGEPTGTMINVDYPEGSDIGYRLFAKTGAKPLFPFGYGLTYTSFAYNALKASNGPRVTVSLNVTNTGRRDGTDVAQIYLLRTPNRQQKRLLGWSRVSLRPGESKRVTVEVDPRLLADWNQQEHGWRRDAGVYQIAAGGSAEDLTAAISVSLPSERRSP